MNKPTMPAAAVQCFVRGMLAGAIWLALWLPVTLPAAEGATVPEAFWSSPRSAQQVVDEEAVAATVRAWEQQPQHVIRIRHPLGERGLLRAEELRDWLVALGVPSTAVVVRAGDEDTQQLQLSVR